MSEADASRRHASPRRHFLREMAGAAGGACLLALGATLYARPGEARPVSAIRPPGAGDEKDFLAACVRCGLCVRDCPWDTLQLATPGDGVSAGTPWFAARRIPCEMCEDIPCVKACPSGALDPALTDIRLARMGTAVLLDQENCLNFLGLRCDVCYRVCPVIDKAITLERRQNPREARESAPATSGGIVTRHALFLPTVHAEACTGCGKCEKSCVLPEAAIRVLPHELARTTPSSHYRRGWEEKEKAGGSLIGDQLRLPARGIDDPLPPGGELP